MTFRSDGKPSHVFVSKFPLGRSTEHIKTPYGRLVFESDQSSPNCLEVLGKIEAYIKSNEPNVFPIKVGGECLVELKYLLSDSNVKCYNTLLGMHFFLSFVFFCFSTLTFCVLQKKCQGLIYTKI